MFKKPFFSIVIPTYNRAAKLQFAIHCLKRQTFRDYEIIVSDNWSTDETKKVVESFRDRRIKYIKNKKPTVYAYNLQNAIDQARGHYVFFHSDDDVLPDNKSLLEIAKKIRRKMPGFIRINYLCISPQKDKLFFFNKKQSYQSDYYIPHNSDKALEFIENVEHFFITGLVFRNTFPRSIRVIGSDHAPWIQMLVYAIKKYGGLFVAKPYIAASWSTGSFDTRKNADGGHPVYSLHDGRLESELYFEIIQKEFSKHAYVLHLKRQLDVMYVKIFPAIKILVGNNELIILAGRLRQLDHTLLGNKWYWIKLLFSLVTPRIILWYIKNVYRAMFIHASELSDSDIRLKKYRKLEHGFSSMFFS